MADNQIAEKIKKPLIQRHNRCGKCGLVVKYWRGWRKMDGWVWHKQCWIDFLRVHR